MPRIIKNNRIVEDGWQIHTLEEDQTPDTVVLPAGETLFTLAVWQVRRRELLDRIATAGVWLESSEEPESLADDLTAIPIIAVNFPKFTDGRSYSTARLLRERYAYRGEIRAIGDVLQDQLFYMRRCGIDAFALKEGRDIEAALAGFNDFSESYQAAVDQPLPLFRRRSAQIV